MLLAYCIQRGLLDQGVTATGGCGARVFGAAGGPLSGGAGGVRGFLSNPDEEKNILDAGHREKIAASVTDIMHYLNHERRAGNPARETPPRTSSFDEPVMR
ncbi:MAG: hypothetical protein U1F77_17390 [Kiritimatiellia bacterium]